MQTEMAWTHRLQGGADWANSRLMVEGKAPVGQPGKTLSADVHLSWELTRII